MPIKIYLPLLSFRGISRFRPSLGFTVFIRFHVKGVKGKTNSRAHRFLKSRIMKRKNLSNSTTDNKKVKFESPPPPSTSKSTLPDVDEDNFDAYLDTSPKDTQKKKKKVKNEGYDSDSSDDAADELAERRGGKDGKDEKEEEEDDMFAPSDKKEEKKKNKGKGKNKEKEPVDRGLLVKKLNKTGEDNE
jgi:hypothetical protein